MKYHLIDTPADLQQASELLAKGSRISLDCEAAGFHRYSDRLCLVQVSTPRSNVILDPLSVDVAPALRPVLEDPRVQVIMHGADYDIRLLHRDLGIRIRGLFDTQVAASLLGATAVGLSSLMEAYLGVKLPKTHQRADWAQRPLPRSMLQYAADDTRHLPALADLLTEGLREKGREAWAGEEFRLLEESQWEDDQADPVTRVKGARELNPRAVTMLREALAWRDEIARTRDRAPFRVVGDQVLLEIVVTRPTSTGALASLKGMSPRLAREQGERLLHRLRQVDDLPEEALVPYPRWKGNGMGRPGPEEEALAGRIRDLRAGAARDLGLDRGVLLSNALILEIVRHAPRTLEGLGAIPGVRSWQVDVLGSELLRLFDGG